MGIPDKRSTPFLWYQIQRTKYTEQDEVEIKQSISTATQNEISVNTIKLHLKNLYAKIQVNSRHEATQLVIGIK